MVRLKLARFIPGSLCGRFQHLYFGCEREQVVVGISIYRSIVGGTVVRDRPVESTHSRMNRCCRAPTEFSTFEVGTVVALDEIASGDQSQGAEADSMFTGCHRETQVQGFNGCGIGSFTSSRSHTELRLFRRGQIPRRVSSRQCSRWRERGRRQLSTN
jgi:hypothetical protein